MIAYPLHRVFSFFKKNFLNPHQGHFFIAFRKKKGEKERDRHTDIDVRTIDWLSSCMCPKWGLNLPLWVYIYPDGESNLQLFGLWDEMLQPTETHWPELHSFIILHFFFYSFL